MADAGRFYADDMQYMLERSASEAYAKSEYKAKQILAEYLSGKKRTSADGLFTLETVACLGACGLAPVMTIDGEVHAKMTPEAALALLEDIRKKEAETV